MKFQIRAGKVATGIRPALDIATKGIVEDFQEARSITIGCNKDEMTAAAHGGRLGINVVISDFTVDDSGYKFEEEGEVTVDATDLVNSLDSFKPDNDIIIKKEGNELIIQDEKDEDQFQALACLGFTVDPPDSDGDYEKEITIERNLFIDSLKKVSFAYGIEEERVRYRHWMARISNKKARFVAGDGMRFAVLDVSADKLIKAKKHADILMPNEQSKVVAALIASSGGDDVVIKANKDQIVFELESYTLTLTGLDPSVQWVKEDNFLELSKGCEIVTQVEDWAFAMKGVRATFNDESRRQHNTHDVEMTVDAAKGQLLFKVDDATMRSARKVPVINIQKKPSDKKPMVFKCPSEYLAEIPKHADPQGKVEIAFVEEDKPVFVSHLPKTNDNGVEENFHVFFAPSKG